MKETKQLTKDRFYLTSIEEENKIADVNLNEKHERKKVAKNNKFSSYLIKNRENFDNTTSHVLDYMVHEETQFTDLTKIEDYYKQKTIDYYDKFNQNSIEMYKKRKLLEDLDLQIGQELVTAIQCDSEQIEKMYKPEVETLKVQIEKQSHDLQSYCAAYSNLNEENFLLKKKLQENIKYSEISDKHYDKYVTIQKNAQRTYKMQKNLLVDMKDFEEISSKQFDREIEKKKMQCNKLEYDVLTVKKDFGKNQNLFDQLRKEIKEVERHLDEREKKNEKLAAEYRMGVREYIKANVTKFQIYRNLRVKDLNSIIKKFQEERIQYQGYNTLFYNLNLEISGLNNTYSSWIDEFKKVKEKLSMIDNTVTEEAFNDLCGKIKFTKENTKNLLQTCNSKEQYLKDIYTFLDKYAKKMNDMIHSITIYALNISHFNSKKREELIFNNGSDKVDLFINSKDLGKEECMNSY